MKKIFLLAATAALLMACGGAKVKVTNPLKLDRTNETVEISWQEVQAKVSDATPENIVVIAPDGSQQPSQVLYNGGTEPQALIFQATVAGNSSATYTLETGQREAYPAQAFGRYVPERMDDFAWENNLIAHRMYGPALEATGEISNGIDIWLKRTDSLIIDKWFKPGYNYHSDQGEGLDCYKVGRTLGAGAVGGMLIGMICQIFIVPALFVVFQIIQEKIKPLKWDDLDNKEVLSEIEQYSK